MKSSLSKKNAPYRVVIVDDHPVVRKGLAYLIGREPDMQVCGEYEDGVSLISALPTLQADVIILDLFLKEGDGMEVLKELKKKFPKIPVLVLSMQDEFLYAERVLSAGALGYVSKEKMLGNVTQALREVLQGQIYADVVVKNKLLKKISNHSDDGSENSFLESLSDRELEVFQLLGRGYSTRAIAERWGRSIKTVGTYRSHLKLKLNILDSSELVRRAALWIKKGKI